MQSKGLDFLRPIWAMIYSDEELIGSWHSNKGLNLSESDVDVTYMRYINNHKKTKKDAKSNYKTIDEAVKDGLTPGKKMIIRNKNLKYFSRKRNLQWSPTRDGPGYYF